MTYYLLLSVDVLAPARCDLSGFDLRHDLEEADDLLMTYDLLLSVIFLAPASYGLSGFEDLEEATY